jgi:hypothetical protein
VASSSDGTLDAIDLLYANTLNNTTIVNYVLATETSGDSSSSNSGVSSSNLPGTPNTGIGSIVLITGIGAIVVGLAILGGVIKFYHLRRKSALGNVASNSSV